MPSLFLRLLRLAFLGVLTCAFAACGFHHPRKVRSYDRSFTTNESDPTYHEDYDRADVEVHDMQ